MSHRVAVVTTSRADYGLLYHVLHAIKADPALRLQLLACGSHLMASHGRTEAEIRADGFRLAARVPLAPADDSPMSAARALAGGLRGFAQAYARLKPGIVLVLGDRFELLAACGAAVMLRLPIAHLHGGESTEGVLDEQVRHAVTKMAHLHLTAAEPYRRRILQMGEDPRRVVNVGAPGLERLRLLDPLPRRELERLAGMRLDRPFALATYHPDGTALRGPEAVLSALDRSRLPVVWTYAGSDPGGRAVNALLRRWAERRPGRAAAVPSLGQRAYLSLLRLCAVVIGNSSSGLIEAPSARVPTVNVGERQAGRLRAPSVIDCRPTASAVAAGLARALSGASRRPRDRNPYGRGETSARVVRALKAALGDPTLPHKSFHDLPAAAGGSR